MRVSATFQDPLLEALRTWQRESRWLTGAFWFHVGLAVMALVAMPLDTRRLLGLNVWVKPLKFDLAVLIYLVTAAVLLRLLGGRSPRARFWLGLLIAVAMIVEDSIISLQSARGVRSHMNIAEPVNAVLFAIMGVFIALNTGCAAVLLGLWLRRVPGVPAALAWGIRLGLLAFLAGSLEGVAMVRHMGHTVGAPDGGAGLPFLNWSTGHGDLRVAHFFALHALQAMLLLGWAISRARWPARGQVAAVMAAFAVYMSVVWVLFSQAMAGQPVLQ